MKKNQVLRMNNEENMNKMLKNMNKRKVLQKNNQRNNKNNRLKILKKIIKKMLINKIYPMYNKICGIVLQEKKIKISCLDNMLI